MSEPAAPEHRAIYLTGPTASGKSAVGVELARLLDAEILALDSMTLYRGMDVGTAKATTSERGGVPHHLIDVLDPWESASVAQYRGWAIEAIRDVESRGRRALFVGGTALYLKAMLRGLFEGPGADPVVRERLEAEAEAQGDAALHARLAMLDPATAARLHPNDRRRIVRALEVIELTGTAFSALQRQHERPASGVRVFALELPRPVLYDRINRRVSAMFDAGLVDEVRRLQSAPRPLSGVAAQGVGYSEVIAHLEGGPGLDRTIDLIQIRTRQFAKRQGTWFRGLAEVAPLAMEPGEPAEAVAKRIAARIEGGGEG
ncbi:tRNA (adenosine(37)-N6)-dimethylallyltransferase MiaA [Planctomyces sp. SH-PL62]|uniref:tRNA (adenosine(37)-N6)-dimethylallyltransferase MiaA n=1 Tax=Planctomyces sp. SH-PL62 TaxID=1636152 RepID=UPI00078D75CB|nr:tRNA (adenosine(37)-N6)-dimethylallyltransferase MiaA [Planctomyces sp. SH-PL62]AMV40001.1 tRNA dimethylallyltransferase [Planctomyces sp. SH-PL62]